MEARAQASTCRWTRARGRARALLLSNLRTRRMPTMLSSRLTGTSSTRRTCSLCASLLSFPGSSLRQTSTSPPPPPPPEPTERGNLRQWLLDAKSRDQYVIRYGDESEVLWNDPAPDAKDKDKEVHRRKKWTDTGHMWSPHGTYIATFHRPGIRLWGGEKFEAAGRFMHNNVKRIEFSPRETFVVTYTWPDRPGDADDYDAAIVWDVRTGEKKRAFKNDERSKETVEPFKWSSDDQYFAKMTEDAIQVYSSLDMKVLDKKSFKFPGVRDFCWSPTQSCFAAYVPSFEQSPARVVVTEVPSRKELKQKNLVNISDVNMQWHPDGTYLCVKVDRQKSKKTTTFSLEMFRMKDKDIPIEVLEIPTNVLGFAWEPKGHRFCLLHGDPPRVDVSFYTMLKEGKPMVTHLKTLEKKTVNEIYWSPAGHHVVLAGMKNLNGVLNFFDVDALESMSEDEHFMCTDLEWDPTGRYVTTYVSAFRQPMENGFTIWNFAGKRLHVVNRDKFFQFIWRPRPPSLLTNKQEREIRKNLPEFSAKYLEEDRKAKELADTAHIREKDEKRAVFNQGEDKRKKLYMEWQQERREIRGCVTDDEDWYELVEETFEEVVESSEEVVGTV
mmetsp:Transcript_46089/g.110990  ORF Transcript_46089/g.110990 Transcript_46089/m.110990 type:complete len:611 (+) Transcript_46089:230-2062(+)